MAKPDRLIEILIDASEGEGERPVLIYQGDGNALLVSRYRDVLAEHFRFVIPSAELMETLQRQAPVPRAVRPARPVSPCGHRGQPDDRPRTNRPALPLSGRSEARATDARPLERDRWEGRIDRKSIAAGQDLVRPETLGREFHPARVGPRPESAVVSYHAYVAEDRTIVGEFTGEKVRTKPPAFGHSCSVRVVSIPEVAELGRRLLRTLDFTGVVKFDFKRKPSGGLALFEVNTKFNLWHLPGAIAGVNLPALVYNDLTGLGRPRETRIERENVVWCKLWDDLPMALSSGVSIWEWLRWIVTVESWRDLAWDDPMAAIGIPLTALAQTSARIRGGSR